MKRILVAAAGVAIFLSSPSDARPVIRDPVALNIGVNCQWQPRCMVAQREAMNKALKFVAKTKPAQWRVQLCNRNASRGGNRVDWIGFDHCIRNMSLRPPAARPTRKRRS